MHCFIFASIKKRENLSPSPPLNRENWETGGKSAKIHVKENTENFKILSNHRENGFSHTQVVNALID